MEHPRPAKQLIYPVLSLLAAFIIALLIGIGSVGLIGPDEPRYAEVAREMFASGDYVSPRLCGCLWFEKPALLYWMIAVAYKALGVSELSARLPSAFSAIISIASIFWIMARTVSLRAALISSFILTTMAVFIGYARGVVTDMPLTASISVALAAVFLSTTGAEKNRRMLWYLGAAFTGAAVLSKGLIGVVLVVAILAASRVLTRQPLNLGWRDFIIGLIIFVAVVSVWYLPVTIKHGYEFIQEFFINHHFKRYTRNRYHHPQPVYFFPLVLLGGVSPWTFYFLPAFRRLGRLRLRGPEKQDQLLVLAWIWLLVPVVFFSFSWSKLPGYILPSFPAAAIILGIEVDKIWAAGRERLTIAAAWLTAALLAALATAFLVYIRIEAVPLAGLRRVAVWIPLAIVVVVIAFLIGGRFRLAVGMTVVFTLSLIAGSICVLLPHIEETASLKRLSLEVAQALRPGEKIAFYLNKEYAPVFYAEGRVVCGTEEGDIMNALAPAPIINLLEAETSLIVITTANWERDLVDNPKLSAEFIGRQGSESAFRLTLVR